MKTFNYAPASPIKDNITMLAVSVGMVVVPLVYPFGIRIGSTRILGPTSTAIVFIIGGLVLLVITLNKVRLARALAANGGKIVVDADSVTYPIIKKGEKTDKIFKISDIKHLKYDDEEGELEIGQVASLFRQQQSVGEVMKELLEEYERRKQTLTTNLF